MTSPAALYNLSLEFLDGKGVTADPEKAFALNAESAALAYGEAVLAMGWFYLNGVGVNADRELARSWYRRSARQGDARALFSLGQMAYADHDHASAVAWMKRASDKGHVRSRFWIGKLYWRGWGVPKDRARAMALFQETAHSKDPEARRTLGLLSRWQRCSR